MSTTPRHGTVRARRVWWPSAGTVRGGLLGGIATASGMALTAMCFNIVHHGVSTKLRTLYQPAAATDAAGAAYRRRDGRRDSSAGSISDLTASRGCGVAEDS